MVSMFCAPRAALARSLTLFSAVASVAGVVGLTGCGAAAAPAAATVVVPSSPEPAAPAARTFVEHLPPDVDGLLRWDFDRIRAWPHSRRFLSTYRDALDDLSCQTEVYDRATEALSAVWVTGSTPLAYEECLVESS